MNKVRKKAISITTAGLFTLAGPGLEAFKDSDIEWPEMPIIKFVRVEETPTPKHHIPPQKYSIGALTSSTATGPDITVANTIIGDDFAGNLDSDIFKYAGQWTVVSSGDAIMVRRS